MNFSFQIACSNFAEQAYHSARLGLSARLQPSRAGQPAVPGRFHHISPNLASRLHSRFPAASSMIACQVVDRSIKTLDIPWQVGLPGFEAIVLPYNLATSNI
jgi:hypothetical protein